MELNVPNLTTDRVCCPTCRGRTPFTPQGRPDWHTDPAGGVCPAVFPVYVTARDPEGGRRAQRRRRP